MATALAVQTPADLEALLIQGDLAKLDKDQRVTYYKAVCESVGLNPLTQPFEYLTLSGRLRLYARKDCTDQLRKIHKVSVTAMDHEMVGDAVYVVTCKVTDASGRSDVATGAVATKGLQGEALANALMKTETKAKRRATLSICGLGMLDETEVEDTPNARPAPPAPEYTPPKAPAPPQPPPAAPAATAPAAASTTPPANTSVPPVPTPGEMWRPTQRQAPAAPPAPAPEADAAPMIDDPRRVDQVNLIRRIMIDKPPTGLAWHPKHAEAWLKKYFGVERPIKLLLGQARDAECLLRARLAGNAEEYGRLLEMFHAEQRVLTADGGDA